MKNLLAIIINILFAKPATTKPSLRKNVKIRARRNRLTAEKAAETPIATRSLKTNISARIRRVKARRHARRCPAASTPVSNVFALKIAALVGFYMFFATFGVLSFVL